MTGLSERLDYEMGQRLNSVEFTFDKHVIDIDV